MATVNELTSESFVATIINKTPLAHFEGVEGNISLFMREEVYDPENPKELPRAIPCITGNSMRHSLRDAIAMETLEAVELEQNSISAEVQAILFSGGSLGKDCAKIDVKRYREITSLLPCLSLMGGGGIGAALTSGLVSSDYAVLMCKQNEWRLVGVEKGTLPPAESFIETRQGTKHDSRRAPKSEKVMTEDDLDKWNAVRTRTAEENHEGGKESDQMIYSYESVIAGARWQWIPSVVYASPLERALFRIGLDRLAKSGKLGGKTNSGHGKVRMTFDGHENGVATDEDRAIWKEHCEKNREQIVNALKTMF